MKGEKHFLANNWMKEKKTVIKLPPKWKEPRQNLNAFKESKSMKKPV